MDPHRKLLCAYRTNTKKIHRPLPAQLVNYFSLTQPQHRLSQPFFLSRSHGGIFGFRFRKYYSSTPRASALASSQSPWSSIAAAATAPSAPAPVQHVAERQQNQQKSSWFSPSELDNSTMAHIVEPSAEDNTPASAATQHVTHGEKQEKDIALSSPFPISTVVHFQLQTQDTSAEDMVMGQYQGEPGYRAGTSLFPHGTRARESISSVISEPIDIPQSPLLPPEAPYLEVQDFSEAEVDWSSAFEPRQLPAHLLKWEAIVKRNKADREQAGHGDKEANASDSEEGQADEGRNGFDDGSEELWWEMEM